MAFMEPEIVHGEWYEVETSNGTWWLPTDVCLEKDLKGYVDGEIQEVTVRAQCWGGRLSASGYMDCTDWCAGFESEEEAKAYLTEMYGEDEE